MKIKKAKSPISKHFAFLPVRVNDKELAWLEWVETWKDDVPSGDVLVKVRRYRAIKK